MIIFLIFLVLFVIVTLILHIWKYKVRQFWHFYISSFILLIPIVLYISNFCESKISKDPSMWAAFGDFFGGIYNVLTSVLIAILSYKLTKIDKRFERRSVIATQILRQIEIIIKNGYHYKSIEKLQRLTKDNKYYLSIPLRNELIKLADDFTESRAENKKHTKELEVNVVDNLKTLINGL